MQQKALKELERDVDDRNNEINALKAKVKDNELKNIENERLLRDEIEMLKDKISKLPQLET